MNATAPAGAQTAGIAGAFASAVAWGASGVIAKAIDMEGLAVVAYRFWLSTVAFFAFMALSGRFPSKVTFRAALPGGLALAADVALFFSAIKLTTVANATVLTAMQPLLMIYLGKRVFGERITTSQILWSLVALVGVGILVFGSAGKDEWSLEGDLLAVGALVAWTGYLFYSKSSQSLVTPLEYTAITGLVSAIGATVFAVVFGQDLSWPVARSWALLGVMAFGSGLGAHLLMNWALTRIPVWFGSTTTLLIPAGATAMAWIWLGESVTVLQIGGIFLTLVALAAVVISRTGGLSLPISPARRVWTKTTNGAATGDSVR